MSSRPGAGGFLLTTLLGSFALVLVLGWLVASKDDDGGVQPPPESAPVRLVVSAGQLGVGKGPVEPIRNVVVVVREKPGAAAGELCLTTPAGSWQPAGKSWQPSKQDRTTRYCRPVEGDELTAPVEIELIP